MRPYSPNHMFECSSSLALVRQEARGGALDPEAAGEGGEGPQAAEIDARAQERGPIGPQAAFVAEASAAFRATLTRRFTVTITLILTELSQPLSSPNPQLKEAPPPPALGPILRGRNLLDEGSQPQLPYF